MKAEETRKCIVCGEVLPKEKMLRFTLAPDNQIVPAFKKKLPGKGIWVKNSKQSLLTAVEKNLFAKAAKKNVKVSPELVNMAESILHKRALDAISLARKAGALVFGFEKVCEAIKKNKVAFVLEAKDAGADGHNKIMNLAKNLEVFHTFNVEELDQELDKVNTVHIALLHGEMAKAVQMEISRLENFLNS